MTNWVQLSSTFYQNKRANWNMIYDPIVMDWYFEDASVAGQGKIFLNDLINNPITPFITSATFGTYAIFADQKASGTDGGTFTAGAWQTRTLNTTRGNNIVGVSLAANQITLPAGTYEGWAEAPASGAGITQCRLYDTTNAAVLAVGQSCDAGMQNISTVMFFFTLAAPAVLELQHQCDSTQLNTGFGVAGGYGTECYSQIRICKIVT